MRYAARVNMESKENNNKRILWINGLKGLACLMVFFHHFFLSFFPAIHYGKESTSRTVSGIDTLMASSPIGVIVNGNFAVCLFVLISAFLFAMKTMEDMKLEKRSNLLDVAVKRYLRLMLTVAPVCVIYYVLLAFLSPRGLAYGGITNQLTVSELIQHILVYQWITMDSLMIGPLWCIYIIFLGTFIAIFFAMLSAKERWYMPFIYLVLAWFSNTLNSLYSAVMLGVLVADIYCFDRINQWGKLLFKKGFCVKNSIRYLLGTVIILLGLLMGGYPSYVIPERGVYYLMGKVLPDSIKMHCFAAAVLMLGIMCLPRKRILSSGVVGYIGGISFGIYLWHSVVINLVSYPLVDYFNGVMGDYVKASLITFLITMILVAGISILYKPYEKAVGKLLKKISL